MFTANSMNCLCEALGVALPGNGSALARTEERDALAREAAAAVMRLVAAGTTFLDIVTPQAIDNAVALDVAMGGSTNTVLHVLALAREAGVDYPLARFHEVAERTPHLTKLSPAWDGDRQWHIQDLHDAGGVRRCSRSWRRSPASSRSTRRPSPAARSARPRRLRPTGTRSASARRRARTRRAGRSRCSRGTSPRRARCSRRARSRSTRRSSAGRRASFECEEDAVAAVRECTIAAGSVIVVRHEGPRGGPGMREMLTLTSMLKGMRLGEHVALVTDGRFSGASRGLCIGPRRPGGGGGRADRARPRRRPDRDRRRRADPRARAGAGGAGGTAAARGGRRRRG
jgi:dihydroxy-acid dehydratase